MGHSQRKRDCESRGSQSEKYLKIYILASLVAQAVKHLSAMQETWVQSLGWEDPLEKEMAAHSSIVAWKTPRMEEPGRIRQSDFTFIFIILALKIEEGCHKLWNTGILWKLKKARKWILPEPPEKAQPDLHFHFSPVKSISDF